MDRVSYAWQELAEGVQQAIVNGKTVRVIRDNGEWYVTLDGARQIERYEVDSAARTAGERLAYIR